MQRRNINAKYDGITQAAETETAEPFAEYVLEDVVITANRIETKKSEVAADVVIVSSEQIERGNYTRASDALKAANIKVVQQTGASYPIINGDDRVLIMVNGRRVTWNHLVVSGSARVGVDLDAFPIDNIERIEIVRGPNSSLYGNKAVAGVVNIITKEPSTEDKTTIRTEVGSYKAFKTALTTQGGEDDWRYMVTLSRSLEGDYRYARPGGGSRHFQGTKINQHAQSVRIDKDFGDDTLTFEFSNTHRNDGNGIYVKNLDTGASYNGNRTRTSTERAFALTYHWKSSVAGAEDFLSIYHNQEKTDSGFTGSIYNHDLKLFGAEYQNNWQLSYNNTLTGGVAYNNEKIKENNQNVLLNASAHTISLYAEDKWRLGRDYTLGLGARLEDHSDFGTDITSHISLSKALSRATNTYLSWGQGVNNPTIKMRYANTPFWVGNPHLEQETSYTITWGLNSKLSDKTTLETSLYHSRLKNALQWQSGSPGWYYNVAREKRRGLELSVNHELSEQWKLRAGYSYSKVEQQTNPAIGYTNYDYNSRPNGYQLGVVYKQGKLYGELTWERVTGRAGRVGQYFQATQYNRVDLGVNYHFNEYTKVYIKGLNLTDESYDIRYGSTTGKYMMPGRSFVIGAEYSF